MYAVPWKKLWTVFERVVEAPMRDPSAQLGELRILDPSLSRRLEALASSQSSPSPPNTQAGVPSSDAGGPPPEGRPEARDSLGLVGRTFSHFDVIEPLRAG